LRVCSGGHPALDAHDPRVPGSESLWETSGRENPFRESPGSYHYDNEHHHDYNKSVDYIYDQHDSSVDDDFQQHLDVYNFYFHNDHGRLDHQHDDYDHFPQWMYENPRILGK
jgi:hypothetical protein